MTYYEDFPPTQPRIARWVVAWTIFFVLLAGGVGAALWGFGVLTADVKGRGEARKQIKSADFRITAYNHFYDLCASVQGNEAALAAQQPLLSGANGDDRERIEANIVGLKAQIARSIAQYNVDARKGYTIGQFRASDLPYQLDYTKGATTSCAS